MGAQGVLLLTCKTMRKMARIGTESIAPLRPQIAANSTSEARIEIAVRFSDWPKMTGSIALPTPAQSFSLLSLVPGCNESYGNWAYLVNTRYTQNHIDSEPIAEACTYPQATESSK